MTFRYTFHVVFIYFRYMHLFNNIFVILHIVVILLCQNVIFRYTCRVVFIYFRHVRIFYNRFTILHIVIILLYQNMTFCNTFRVVFIYFRHVHIFCNRFVILHLVAIFTLRKHDFRDILGHISWHFITDKCFCNRSAISQNAPFYSNISRNVLKKIKNGLDGRTKKTYIIVIYIFFYDKGFGFLCWFSPGINTNKCVVWSKNKVVDGM